MDSYRLTGAEFLSLASGFGDPGAIGVLVDARLARHRLLVLAAAEQGQGASGLDLLARVEELAPAEVERALRHPFLPVWAVRMLRGGPADDRAASGYLGGLAVAAAVRAGLPFRLDMTCQDGRLVLPSLGTATGLGVGPVRVCGEQSALRLAGTAGRREFRYPCAEPAPGWQPVREIGAAGGLVLAVEDADPYRDCFGRPVARWLAPERLAQLTELYGQAWRMLLREQPEHAAGMRAVLRALVPLRDPAAGKAVSATSRDAFGAVALSIPLDAERLAEALVHEYQHAKLGALLDLVELYQPDGRNRYHAPWRPDPRPVGPTLQGAYAYTGVSGFWRGRLRHDPGSRLAAGEFAHWRQQTAAAVRELLAGGELTRYGQAFAQRLEQTLRAWEAEPVP